MSALSFAPVTIPAFSPMLMNESDEARFWSHVNVRGIDDCWEWQATLDADDYGVFKLSGKQWKAHRLTYLLTNGVIPEGKIVRHAVCNNPACCNPRHLDIGTQQDNMDDKVRAGRQASIITDAQAQEIRDLYASGDYTQTELGERYGISQGAIHDIIVGGTWATWMTK